MGILDLIKAPDYDAIDAVAVESNLLMCTESKPRQSVIKKLKVGSLVNLKLTKQNRQNVYIVSNYKTSDVIGEISYGTSDYLAQNYKNYKMLGKVTEIGKFTPMGSGKQVRIEYKVYL